MKKSIRIWHSFVRDGVAWDIGSRCSEDRMAERVCGRKI